MAKIHIQVFYPILFNFSKMVTKLLIMKMLPRPTISRNFFTPSTDWIAVTPVKWWGSFQRLIDSPASRTPWWLSAAQIARPPSKSPTNCSVCHRLPTFKNSVTRQLATVSVRARGANSNKGRMTLRTPFRTVFLSLSIDFIITISRDQVKGYSIDDVPQYPV